MAGAPYGNRNAEKWTFRKAVNLFTVAIEMSQEKTGSGKAEKYKYDYVGEIARELETYKSIFTELVKKFPALKRKHIQLIETLEANCFCNSKKGKIKEATAIVNLKSNHGWTDRVDNSHTITDKRKSVDELFPTDEEINEKNS